MHLELPLEGLPVFLMVEPSLQSTQLFNKKGKNPSIQNIQIFTALTLGEYSDKREVISRAASQAGNSYVSEREVVMPCISVYCDIVLVYTSMCTETSYVLKH